jgi:hypothetical protein
METMLLSALGWAWNPATWGSPPHAAVTAALAAFYYLHMPHGRHHTSVSPPAAEGSGEEPSA